MRRRVFSILFCAIAAAAGCGDFDGYKLAAQADGGTTQDPSASLPIDEPEAPSAAGGCAEGKKLCNDLCVSLRDPRFGCGARTCEPCSIAKGEASCQGGACAVAACEQNRADCNKSPSDGCETTLSTDKNNCGGCGIACADDEVCGPSGCATSCPSNLKKCGQACVDTQTDAQHCGACNAGCPAPANGSASCSGGSCKAQCNAGYRLCGASCVAESPTSCGATCKVCPSTANGTPLCNAGACSIKCNVGYQACATGCCVIAPVCKADGASCTNKAECCHDICFASMCLCMQPGQSCDNDKQCCNGKKCGFYDGSPNKCIP